MRKLLLVLLASCLMALAAGADVSVDTNAASVSADFAAEVDAAVASESDEVAALDVVEEEDTIAEEEGVAADDAEDESALEEAEEEADDEEAAEAEADEEEAEQSGASLIESKAEGEVTEEDMAEFEEAEQELDAAEAGTEEGEAVSAEEEAESVEQLEAELAAVESEANEFEAVAEAVEQADEPVSFLEQFDDVAADSMMEATATPADAMRMAEAKGFGNFLKKAAKGAAKVAKKVVKAGAKLAKKAVKLVKKVAKKGGKLLGKLWKGAKKVAKKVVKAGKKLVKKIAKHGGKGLKMLGKLAKKGLKYAVKHHFLKKALKFLCKVGLLGRACRKNKHCRRGLAGHACRKERCRGHALGCRYKCRAGNWSKRRPSKMEACANSGGVMEPQPHHEMDDELEHRLDVEQGVLTHGGDLGSAAQFLLGGHFGGGRRGGRGDWVVASPRGHHGRHGPHHVRVVDSSRNGGMWNGVDPKFYGKPDLPNVPRLPEDVEDCVACQYVWKQVEMDVGNSAITQTIYDSFHANANDAQRTPVFYPACQTMFDAVDDMIGDYMEGYTVNQICENSMLCRPRDLSQFLKHQRATKGI